MIAEPCLAAVDSETAVFVLGVGSFISVVATLYLMDRFNMIPWIYKFGKIQTWWGQLAVGSVACVALTTVFTLAWEALKHRHFENLGMVHAGPVKASASFIARQATKGVILVFLVLGLEACYKALGSKRWWMLAFPFFLVTLVLPPLLTGSMNYLDQKRLVPMPKGAKRAAVEKSLADCGVVLEGLHVHQSTLRRLSAWTVKGDHGAHLIFTRKAMEVLTPPEAAAIAVHEAYHVLHRDFGPSLLQIISGILMLIWVHVRVLGPGSKDRGWATRLGPALPWFFMVMVILKVLFHPAAAWWSRQDEFAADAFALRQGTAPWALKGALGKLARVNDLPIDSKPLFRMFIRSHPTIHDRILQTDRWNSLHRKGAPP